MHDLISRQAALDCVTYDVEYTTERIKALPSLQPACNQLVTDCISRVAAVDAIVGCTVYGNADDLKEAVMQENAWNKWSGGVLEALDAIEELPSAHPERKEGRDE